MVVATVYPIFLQCCVLCSDPFWETVFNDLVYGKTPCGTYIHNNFLCCGYKNKEFSYKIDEELDVQILHNDIMSLFRDRLGLLSLTDRKKLRLSFNSVKKSLTSYISLEWDQIRKKNVKSRLIELFVIKNKRKYRLSDDVTKRLLSSILLGILFRTIDSKNIQYEYGEIKSIDILEFSHNTYRFTKPIISTPQSVIVKAT